MALLLPEIGSQPHTSLGSTVTINRPDIANTLSNLTGTVLASMHRCGAHSYQFSPGPPPQAPLQTPSATQLPTQFTGGQTALFVQDVEVARMVPGT